MQKFRKILSFALALLLTAALTCTFIAPESAKADAIDDMWDSLFEDEYDYFDDEDYYEDEDVKTEPSKNTTNSGAANTLDKANTVSGYSAFVYDYAGLFSQTEAKTLLDEVYAYTEFGDMVVLTTNENPYGSSQSATDSYCDNFYKKYSKNSNCVIFIIDMHTRYLLVYAKGSVVEDNITRSKCDTITDNVYTYASSKEYYTCASKAFEQIGNVLKGMSIAQPMKVVSNIFLSSVIGFVIMYLVALGKSKVGKPSDDELLKYAVINFAATNPNDVITGTTKTYCPRSSGSGGGGRSGGGGGGHTSGGHRF